jgi:hypothetical protein
MVPRLKVQTPSHGCPSLTTNRTQQVLAAAQALYALLLLHRHLSELAATAAPMAHICMGNVHWQCVVVM